MAMLNLIDDSAKLAAQLLSQPHAKEFRIRLAVSRQRPISQLRSKILWIGKLRLKMKFRQYSIWPMA
jgi:hypothetical protein